jgi:hypothetical protein
MAVKPVVQQHLDPATYKAVLASLVMGQQLQCLKQLLQLQVQLPGTQLGCTDVEELLQMAVDSSSALCLAELCKLQAAQQVSISVMLQLLRDAVQKDCAMHLQLLCKLDAAHGIDRGDAEQLLQAAAARPSYIYLEALCGLQAAQ